jgi:glycosyltransferase involved in cell wall biosynthesis
MAPRRNGTIDTGHDRPGSLVVVAAREEAPRIGATLAALRRALPAAELWVADDASRDRTAAIARAMGASVHTLPRRAGKGAAVEACLLEALARDRPHEASERERLVLLCDGDLAESAGELAELVRRAAAGPGLLLVAEFARPQGGGVGVLRAFARRAIAERCGVRARAPLSGQRVLRAGELRGLLPLAAGYGMEVAMTIDAIRAGMELREVPLELRHRALGRTAPGFAHRARQLLDVIRAVRARRRGATTGRSGGGAREETRRRARQGGGAPSGLTRSSSVRAGWRFGGHA